MAESLLKDLEMVQAVQAEIKTRQQRLMAAFEATISELNASKRLLYALENQQKVLQAEMQRLTSLIHPVRRLPIELLVAIFEETVETTVSGLEIALTLSQVCRTWRNIALDAPRLWRKVTLIPSDNSDEFWAVAIPRIRSLPASVRICTIVEDDLPLLRRWKLSTIPNLEQLTLGPSCDGPTTHSICKSLFESPYMPLKKLTILPSEMLGGKDLLYSIPTGHFPSFLTLAITGNLGSIRFDVASSPTITTLNLDWVDSINMHEVLQFLQLEILKLIHVKFDTPTGQDGLIAPRIRPLHLEDSPLFQDAWAAGLKFPQLTSLYNGDQPTELFIASVPSHPAIKDLGCVIAGDQLATYAAAIPNLTSLYTEPPFVVFINWREAGMLHAPFPSLRVVTLAERITSAQFEEVVRRRCLPLSHSLSLLEPSMFPVKELRIAVRAAEWSKAPWAQHELAQSAFVEVIRTSERECCLCVVYRW